MDNIIRVLAPVNLKGNGAETLDANLQALKANLRDLAEQTPQYKQYGSPKDELRLDVLMETGTGKTFTYLQTIFELNKHYGLTKFVIVSNFNFVFKITLRDCLKYSVHTRKRRSDGSRELQG